MPSRIDPKLSKAIRKNLPDDAKVHAAFTLRNGSDGTRLTPETTDQVVREIVERASKETDTAAEGLVVFKNLQSFAIEAPASLVEKLTGDDAIGTAALGS
ncbi:hypothetical protein [Sphingomonas sp. SUN039]|uniref:hypothetical protein n=1 Tax=Sphingomonas sp. SUN039 TaxID=2937787 RepID=UPI002164D1E4|nr:hypothetical protein [Sphingomonas sp. SUN039]UVO52813.1 hypothetical protein M0209_01255 [Sphingomonas sp. SUN039]